MTIVVVQWPSGRASDSEVRDPGFYPYFGRVVSPLLPTALVKTQEAVAVSILPKNVDWDVNLNSYK